MLQFGCLSQKCSKIWSFRIILVLVRLLFSFKITLLIFETPQSASHVYHFSVPAQSLMQKSRNSLYENFMPPGARLIIHEAFGAVTMGANWLQLIQHINDLYELVQEETYHATWNASGKLLTQSALQWEIRNWKHFIQKQQSSYMSKCIHSNQHAGLQQLVFIICSFYPLCVWPHYQLSSTARAPEKV